MIRSLTIACFPIFSFIVGLGMVGCANQRDLVSETTARRIEIRSVNSRIDFTDSDVNRLENRVKALEQLKVQDATFNSEVDSDFEEMASASVRSTDAYFCAKAMEHIPEEWQIQAFCTPQQISAYRTKRQDKAFDRLSDPGKPLEIMARGLCADPPPGKLADACRKAGL